MQWWEALLLGAIQGVTEFLPVSSSGHLVLFQELLGFSEPLLLFDTLLHLATVGAVIIYFWKRLLSLSLTEALYVGLGTIPAGLLGVLFADQIEHVFGNVLMVGVALLVTGAINLFIDRTLGARDAGSAEPATGNVTARRALWVGVAQAMAIFPGISRSGSTVAAGVGLGLDRSTAFRLSFFLSIPVILGATLIHVPDVLAGEVQFELLPTVLGVGVAFLVGLASLRLFEWILTKARMELFAWYCFGLGTLTILSQLIW